MLTSAGAELAGHLESARHRRSTPSRKAVRAVVGDSPRPRRCPVDDRDDRAEDLLAGDPHVVGRRRRTASARRTSPRRGPCGARHRPRPGALGAAGPDSPPHAPAGAARSSGPTTVGRGRVAHGHLRKASASASTTSSCRVAGARIRVWATHAWPLTISRPSEDRLTRVQVGVVEHDRRRLAAQLQADPLERSPQPRP